MVEFKIRSVPAKVGMMSLIGVGHDRPARWGNYFSLWNGPRVVNFWSENLETLVENRTLEDGQVTIQDYGDHCLIMDSRIPQEWYYNKLCFTGGRSPSLDVIKHMYETVGDPDNELEQHTNPEKYWADRGGSYKNGIVRLPMKI